jgi:hypothetical protein
MFATMADHRRWGLLLLTVLSLISVLAFYDTTVGDADLWWHLAYGRHCIAHQTWTVDHAAYAWTPFSSAWIYVSWLGDTILYAVHALGGEVGLRLLQVALYLGIATLWGRSRRRFDLLSVLAILAALLVMKPAAVQVKNTMFSAVLAASVLAVYLHARQASRHRFWLLPPLYLVWVNSHGEVILGVVLLGLLTGGEVVLRLLKRPSALSDTALRHLLAAAGLSLLALGLTPETWRLPAYWLGRLGGEAAVAGGAVIRDVAPTHGFLHAARLQDMPRAGTTWLWLAMSGALVPAVWAGIRSRRWDELPLAVAAVFFVGASWFLGRLLLLAPLVWLFALIPALDRIDLTTRPRLRQLATAATLLLAVGALGARTLIAYEADWCGPRLSAAQPVAAARFVADHDLPGPLFNDYQSGGYLIWALGPERPVFIDPRYTPYAADFRAAYVAFQRDPSVDGLRALHARHGFATAVISNVEAFRVAQTFQAAPEWMLLHLGPAASVFVHREHGTPALSALAADVLAADRFATVDNLSTLIGLTNVASAVSPGETLRLLRTLQHNVPGWKLLKPRVEDTLLRYCEARAFASGEAGGTRLTAAQVQQRFALYYLNGEVDLARLIATGYLVAHPDDAAMHYNLACVESRAGDLRAAYAALAAALDRGYDQFDRIDTDQDLTSLRADRKFVSFRNRWQGRRAARAAG